MEAGPFKDYHGMYSSIDDIQQGSAPWKCIQTVVDKNLPLNAPEWQTTSYQVWYRDPETVIANILANPELAKDFDTTPYVCRNKQGTGQWCDFMSWNFAWRHVVSSLQTILAFHDSVLSPRLKSTNEEGDEVEGSMLVPVILGADKTTVSVATGHVEYHPLYLSIGNITNAVCRAHCNAVVPIGFLAIPKCRSMFGPRFMSHTLLSSAERKYDNNVNF